MITVNMAEMLRENNHERRYHIHRPEGDVLIMNNSGDMFNRTRAKEIIETLYPGSAVELFDTYGNKINDM